MSQRRSSFERLADLPAVFDVNGFARVGELGKEGALTYLSRWSREGLVTSAGPRSGVYYNAVKAREVTAAHRATALRMTYPSAVLVGATVIHDSGWTTQIPHEATVAVLSRRTYKRIDGFSVVGRPRSWYAKARAGTVLPGRDGSLASLTPAFALADAYVQRDAWVPDPDDLEVPDEDWPRVAEAFSAFGEPVPEALSSWFGGQAWPEGRRY